MSVIVSNVTLVDNGMGVMPLIYAPPSLSHAYADKTVHVQVDFLSRPSLFLSYLFISRIM